MSAAPRLRIVARTEPVVYVRPQSRLGSWVESIVNVGLGFSIGLLMQVLMFPWFGIHVSVTDNVRIAGIFTAVAVVRSFAVRRAFVAYRRRQARIEGRS